MAIIADPEHRIVLLNLRELWIALGNEPSACARDGTDRRRPMSLTHIQLSTVVEIHTQLMARCRNAMH